MLKRHFFFVNRLMPGIKLKYSQFINKRILAPFLAVLAFFINTPRRKSTNLIIDHWLRLDDFFHSKY